MGKVGQFVVGAALLGATFLNPLTGVFVATFGRVGAALIGVARVKGLEQLLSALAGKRDTGARYRELRTQGADTQAFLPIIYGTVELL